MSRRSRGARKSYPSVRPHRIYPGGTLFFTEGGGLVAIKHISETAHWYTLDGQPAYDADLRRARKESLFPSVTSYTRILAKTSIENWRINKYLGLAALTPRNPGEADHDWIMRVSALAQIECAKPAERGTALHKMIEEYLTDRREPEDPAGKQACAEITAWLAANCKSVKSEITVVNAKEGVAGRIDLLLDEAVIADIKTSANPPSRPWPEWGLQLAGYYLAASLPPVHAFSLCVHAETGALTVHEWPKEKIVSAAETFRSIMHTWRLVKGYDPRRREG